ncbi:tRNA lysidine(34) synthetase TilS [Chroococcidiopsis sp. CCALA 051]|uniref:tRNA lysidine(34) synthetase TilS n=1 Tax=Chroococcidiopsis sp. CCALA 051 TaxID=869949 RepID=UPI000D0DD894|nr:tRNA lysidine(34) synthetase TilS [Chroococcidiopsis sp. CCALA 051]
MSRANWTPLHARLHRTLRSRHLLEKHQRLLVAVSGGQDSLCLVQLLLDLQPKWEWQLGIAHCDHRWRSDSQANADFVARLAQRWKVPFYCHTAEQPLLNEAAARQWRYQALAAIAQTHNYPYIATGHTASDRAETLLYNLIRGSGADGLQALTWQRPLHVGTQSYAPLLVRPLLEVTRTETAQFCQERQLQVWEDTTNLDLKYARNRIRQELLPYIQTHFNSQVELTLAQTAELLQAEVEYLERAADELRQLAVDWEDKGIRGQGDKGEVNHQLPITHYPLPITNSPTKIDRRILQTAHIALQRRVMRQILQQTLRCSPNFEQIEKLMALIAAPNGTQTDPFPGGAIATVDKDWIWLK